MIDLPTLLTKQNIISQAAYGQYRHPGVTISDVQVALAQAHKNPLDLYAWVDVILAGVEGGFRSGATPFALAQAIVNRQGQMASTRYPPQLAQQADPAPKQEAKQEESIDEELMRLRKLEKELSSNA